MQTNVISRITLASLLGLIALTLLWSIGMAPVGAVTIQVSGNSCTLADAITAANTDTAAGGCAAGSGPDEIQINNLSSIDADLPPVVSDITIVGNGQVIDVDAPTAFIVDGGGQLTLEGVNFEVERMAVLVRSGHVFVTDSLMTGFKKIVLDGPTADVTIRDSAFVGWRPVEGSGRDVLIENTNITGERASVLVDSVGEVVIRNSFIEFGGVSVGGNLIFENSIMWDSESGLGATSGSVRFSTVVQGVSAIGGGLTAESSIFLTGFPCGLNIQDGGTNFAIDGLANGGHACPPGFTVVDFSIAASQPVDLGCARSTPTGCVLSVPLAPGSPAIGASSNCPSTDVRGSVRPAASCDAGATQSGPFTQAIPQPPVAPPVLCGNQVVTVNLALGEVPTAGDDVILGTPNPDVINGLGGNDVICGLQGADIIDGGRGGDVIFGGKGWDRITGGRGSDILIGGAGRDQIRGQRGHDTIDGGSGNDLLIGGKGADQISGSRGQDVLIGASGNDLLVGNRGPDQLQGNDGDDLLLGGRDLDAMNGGPGLDGCSASDPDGHLELRVNCEGNA